MFGYIKPNVGELRVKEHAVYKAVYCGLCATGGKRVSLLTRALLSNDFVFLAMLRFCFSDEKLTVSGKRCVCFPLRKSPMIGECETLVYSACAFAVLTYYKLLDNVNDKKGFGRFFARLGLLAASPMRRRAKRLYPDLDDTVKEPLAELSALEKNGETCLDRAADCFARMIAAVASRNLEGADARIAYSCGYHTGRFIYIADALDDLDEDAKSGSYNAILASEKTPEAARANSDMYIQTLNDSMNALSLGFELCDESGDNETRQLMREVIRNIALYAATVAFAKNGGKKKGR